VVKAAASWWRIPKWQPLLRILLRLLAVLKTSQMMNFDGKDQAETSFKKPSPLRKLRTGHIPNRHHPQKGKPVTSQNMQFFPNVPLEYYQ